MRLWLFYYDFMLRRSVVSNRHYGTNYRSQL